MPSAEQIIFYIPVLLLALAYTAELVFKAEVPGKLFAALAAFGAVLSVFFASETGAITGLNATRFFLPALLCAVLFYLSGENRSRAGSYAAAMLVYFIPFAGGAGIRTILCALVLLFVSGGRVSLLFTAATAAAVVLSYINAAQSALMLMGAFYFMNSEENSSGMHVMAAFALFITFAGTGSNPVMAMAALALSIMCAHSALTAERFSDFVSAKARAVVLVSVALLFTGAQPAAFAVMFMLLPAAAYFMRDGADDSVNSVKAGEAGAYAFGASLILVAADIVMAMAAFSAAVFSQMNSVLVMVLALAYAPVFINSLVIALTSVRCINNTGGHEKNIPRTVFAFTLVLFSLFLSVRV